MKITAVLLAERPLANLTIGRHRHRRGHRSRMALVHGMQLSLCEGQHRAAARRTDPLIMLSRTILGVIAVAQVPLDLNEIMHVHLRGESMVAAAAARRLAAHGDTLVEF